MNGYSRPWRRPRKINPSGHKYRLGELFEEELDIVRAYGEGFSLLEMSGAYQCDKTTVLKMLRECCKKIAGSAKPVMEDNAGHISKL